MSEEFSQLPDMNAMLAQRIAAKQAESNGTNPAPGTFDPYQAMLDRKNGKVPEAQLPEAQKWPEEDVQKLQTYSAYGHSWLQFWSYASYCGFGYVEKTIWG